MCVGITTSIFYSVNCYNYFLQCISKRCWCIYLKNVTYCNFFHKIFSNIYSSLTCNPKTIFGRTLKNTKELSELWVKKKRKRKKKQEEKENKEKSLSFSCTYSLLKL